MKPGRRGAKRRQQIAAVFHALADPSRCQVIDLLRDAGEMRVGDVAAAFEMTLNGVSKHLKVLEAAGLLQRRREGTSHFISVRWEGLAPVVLWLDSHRNFWERRLDAFADSFEETEV